MNTAVAQSQFTSPDIRPAAIPCPADPTRPKPRPHIPPAPPPDMPSFTHRLLPRSVRNAMAAVGWWQTPVPQNPSGHLIQTLAVLNRYGWGRSLDFSPTGRMCIRGAQTLLETTDHVTPAARQRAIQYMQSTLAEQGVTMPYFAWNDLPDQQFPAVQALLETAAAAARQNGE